MHPIGSRTSLWVFPIQTQGSNRCCPQLKQVAQSGYNGAMDPEVTELSRKHVYFERQKCEKIKKNASKQVPGWFWGCPGLGFSPSWAKGYLQQQLSHYLGVLELYKISPEKCLCKILYKSLTCRKGHPEDIDFFFSRQLDQFSHDELACCPARVGFLTLIHRTNYFLHTRLVHT